MLGFRAELEEWTLLVGKKCGALTCHENWGYLYGRFFIRFLLSKNNLLGGVLDVTPNWLCQVCGQERENMERLFFLCENARRIWQASRIGLNFEAGDPKEFSVWFASWLKEVRDVDVIRESICLLWFI